MVLFLEDVIPGRSFAPTRRLPAVPLASHELYPEVLLGDGAFVKLGIRHHEVCLLPLVLLVAPLVHLCEKGGRLIVNCLVKVNCVVASSFSVDYFLSHPTLSILLISVLRLICLTMYLLGCLLSAWHACTQHQQLHHHHHQQQHHQQQQQQQQQQEREGVGQ